MVQWIHILCSPCISRGIANHVFIVDASKPGQGEDAVQTFRKLKIRDDDVNHLFSKFLEIDKDFSGEIDLDEFYRYFKLSRTPFADRVFSIMDEDGSGEIDFREFVIAIWNYCTFDLPALVLFAFGLFDLDGSGFLDGSEVQQIVREVYGDTYENNARVQRIVELIDSDGDGVISFREFQEFNRKYPAILFPAFKLQNHIRSKVFGVTWWERASEERRKMGGGRCRNIYEILELMTENEFKKRLDNLIAEESKRKFRMEQRGELTPVEMLGDGNSDGSGSKKRKKKKKRRKKKKRKGEDDDVPDDIAEELGRLQRMRDRKAEKRNETDLAARGKAYTVPEFETVQSRVDKLKRKEAWG